MTPFLGWQTNEKPVAPPRQGAMRAHVIRRARSQAGCRSSCRKGNKVGGCVFSRHRHNYDTERVSESSSRPHCPPNIRLPVPDFSPGSVIVLSAVEDFRASAQQSNRIASSKRKTFNNIYISNYCRPRKVSAEQNRLSTSGR